MLTTSSLHQVGRCPRRQPRQRGTGHGSEGQRVALLLKHQHQRRIQRRLQDLGAQALEEPADALVLRGHT